MKKPNPKNQPKAFDVHRTLPREPVTSAQTQPPRPGRSWKRTIKRSLLLLLSLLLAVVIIIGIWDARNIGQAAKKLFGSGNILSLLNSSGLNQDSRGRVNVLIAGYSVGDPGHPAAALTDSIILLSMDPASHTGYMLSIPRDLYVNIPGFGHAKINEAYQDGGMTLLLRVVENDFQVQIGYWALVNYKAVKGTVDALGGITVEIKSPDRRGLYDPNISQVDGGPLKLKNGSQRLNGQTALNLTRARGDPSPDGRIAYGFAQSDFDRTQHQRQVFTAIKDRLSWTLILTPWKNSQILGAVSQNLKTDVKINAARPLFGLFNSIPSNKLQSISLRTLNGHNYLSSYSTPLGQSALIPSAGIDDFSLIDAALQNLSR